MRATIKVLVVDDSALIRQLLTRALSVDPRIEIVGVAKTGVEAIEKARELEPDVITLDIEMPELSGLEALPYLKKHSRARVVMLSSLDDPDTTYQALAAGAVDFLAKPRSGVASSMTDLSEVLLKKIRTAYRVDPLRLEHAAHAIAEVRRPAGKAASDMPTAASVATGLESVVAIAASTGGPPALERVFEGLSASIPAAYLIVQHLPAGFSESLAKRLTAAGDIPVREALDGMPIEPGVGYLAPHGFHMCVAQVSPGRYAIHLDDSPSVHGLRPAADPLFFSVAALFGSRAMGVVLTGMGADGAQGLCEIKERGGDTVVQNEETSVVWGMPGVAVKMGAANHVVPIGLVAAEIRRSTRVGGAV